MGTSHMTDSRCVRGGGGGRLVEGVEWEDEGFSVGRSPIMTVMAGSLGWKE